MCSGLMCVRNISPTNFHFSIDALFSSLLQNRRVSRNSESLGSLNVDFGTEKGQDYEEACECEPAGLLGLIFKCGGFGERLVGFPRCEREGGKMLWL